MNGIGDEGVGYLAAGLAQHSALSHLSLRFNHIGDAGTLPRSDSASGISCPELTIAAACYCKIKGARSLEPVLRTCPNLSHVDLTFNRIGAARTGTLQGFGVPVQVVPLLRYWPRVCRNEFVLNCPILTSSMPLRFCRVLSSTQLSHDPHAAFILAV
eukprot:1134671-Rhodomonas_salina.1